MKKISKTILKLGVKIFFVSGHRYTGTQVNRFCLFNFLRGSAKMANWSSQKNQILGVGSIDSVEVFLGDFGRLYENEYAY